MKNDIIKQALDILEKGYVLLGKDDQKNYFEKTIASIKNASELVGDNKEKEVYLVDASVKYANQLCFILFRDNTLPDSLAEEYRKLPTPEETSENVKEFTDARDARFEELKKQHQVATEEQKDLDIFLGVIAGMSPEEAARKMAEHDAQLAQMRG